MVKRLAAASNSVRPADRPPAEKCHANVNDRPGRKKCNATDQRRRYLLRETVRPTDVKMYANREPRRGNTARRYRAAKSAQNSALSDTGGDVTMHLRCTATTSEAVTAEVMNASAVTMYVHQRRTHTYTARVHQRCERRAMVDSGASVARPNVAEATTCGTCRRPASPTRARSRIYPTGAELAPRR